MNALISVIVPVYNVEQYITRCLESIAAQTYKNLEILLIDDGSTDRSGIICDEFAAKDARIRVIHKPNEGVSSARNLGMQMCTGEYIMFVDSDDYIPKRAAMDLYLRMCMDASDMVIAKHTEIYDTGEENDVYCAWISDEISTAEGLFQKLAEGRNVWPGLWGKLMKREVLNGLKMPDMCCGEDLWVFPQIIQRCNLISLMDKTVYYYCQRKESVLHQLTEDCRRDDLRAVLNMVSHMLEQGIYSGASRFFKLAIERAFCMKDRKAGLAVIRERFKDDILQELMSGQSRKTRIKWLSLRYPTVYWCIALWKKAKVFLFGG